MQPIALDPYFTASIDATCPSPRGTPHRAALATISQPLLTQTRALEIAEAQGEATERSWKSACTAPNTPLCKRYNTMMQTALCTQEQLPPDTYPFRPVNIRGPNGRVEVVSCKALQEVLGWDDEQCNGLSKTSEIALGRCEIVMPILSEEEGPAIFDAIVRLATGDAELPSYPPRLLAALFIAADWLLAPRLQASIVQRCTELLADPEQRQRAVEELLEPMLLVNASIANHVDLSDLLGAYCHGGGADRFIIAMDQAQSPAEWLAIGYEVTQATETTIRNLAAYFGVEQTPVRITAATDRAALLGSLRAIVFASDPRNAVQKFASKNFFAELDAWQQQAVTDKERANRAKASRKIVDAFEQNSRKLDFHHILELKSVPKAIGYLTELEWLDLSDNQLSSLPAQISRLTALQWLCLNNNQLSSLPPQISNLRDLRYIILTKNPLLPQTLSVQLPPNCTVKR